MRPAERRRYAACVRALPDPAFYVFSSLYALHALEHLDYISADQIFLVRMDHFPTSSEHAHHFAAELATFLQLPKPRDTAALTACVGAKLRTNKKGVLRIENASIADTKMRLVASAAGARLKAFLDGHDRALERLAEREGIPRYLPAASRERSER